MKGYRVGLASLLAAGGCSDAFTDKNGELNVAESGTTDSVDSTVEVLPADLDVAGVATDALGLPLAGVTVTVGSSATITGVAGDFHATLPPEGGTIYFAKGGQHSASRFVAGGSKAKVRVALSPTNQPWPVDVSLGDLAAANDESTLTIPAGALGTTGLAAVTFSPFDLYHPGAAANPNDRGAAGELAVVFAVAEISAAGVDGPLTPSSSLQASLVFFADTVGASLPVLRDDGSGWIEVGTASVASAGDGHRASFDVSTSGTYAVGYLVDGCVTGQVLDSAGSPVSGALVRSYLRPVASGPAAWLDDVESAEDGRFTLLGPSLGVDIFAEASDADGNVTMAYATTIGSGSALDPTSCGEVGALTLSAAGCAIASVYEPDGSHAVDTPFLTDEGDVSYTDAEGGLSFWARPGREHPLVGPGNFTDTFTTSSGTSPTNADCSRLGNIQLDVVCATVHAETSDGSGLAGVVLTGAEFTATTDTSGDACFPAAEGTIPLTVSWVRGAQAIVLEESLTVERGSGTCYAGECTEGPDFSMPISGCATGTVYDEDGNPAAGVRVVSSVFDSVESDDEGAFSLSTAGLGTAAVWAEDRGLTYFPDATDGSCTPLELYSSAGDLPVAVVATTDNLFRVEADGSFTELFNVSSGWPGSITEVDASSAADRLLSLHYATLPYISGLDGSDFASFASNLWSAARISPDGLYVALQGYGAANPLIAIYDIDGDYVRQLSTSAGTAPEGLAWSGDGVWVVNTTKEGDIVVTPSSAARGPVTIADSTCEFPVWWDSDTVALDCTGASMLVDMDGSRTLSWLDNVGMDDRIRDVSGIRVAYTSGESLHLSSIDLSDDVVVYTGTPGTTFNDVHFDGSGLWLLAIVEDPVNGTDVLAVADQIPYGVEWLTATPATVELAASWAE